MKCLWAGFLGLIIVTAGCATSAPLQDQPARLTKPGAAVLQQTVERALGTSVMLAEDTLINSSQLIIERQRRRGLGLGQGLIHGSDLSAPLETFTLLRSDDHCVLVKSSDQTRWPLEGLDCIAE